MTNYPVELTRRVAWRQNIFVLLLGLFLVQGGCATTRIVDIASNIPEMRDREVTVAGTVVRQAFAPQEIENVFKLLRFTFPGTTAGLPQQHYYFELDDGSGAIWVISQRQFPPLGRRVQVTGVVREVVTLPLLGTYNLVDIAGWKTLLPGEVRGDYVVIE